MPEFELIRSSTVVHRWLVKAGYCFAVPPLVGVEAQQARWRAQWKTAGLFVESGGE